MIYRKRKVRKLMKVEKIVRPIINRMNVFRNDVFIHFLKNRGVDIGRGCYFFAPMKTTIDVQRPHMLQLCKSYQGCCDSLPRLQQIGML